DSHRPVELAQPVLDRVQVEGDRVVAGGDDLGQVPQHPGGLRGAGHADDEDPQALKDEVERAAVHAAAEVVRLGDVQAVGGVHGRLGHVVERVAGDEPQDEVGGLLRVGVDEGASGLDVE